MNTGDLVLRHIPFDDHNFGIIIQFDDDNDPIILWDGGNIEEEYAAKVSVLSKCVEISTFTNECKNKKIPKHTNRRKACHLSQERV